MANGSDNLMFGVNPGIFTGCELNIIEAPTNNTIAWGWVEIVGSFKINIRLVEGKYGKFVNLPSHLGKDKNGADKWFNDVDPIKFWTEENDKMVIDKTKPNVQAALNQYILTQYEKISGSKPDDSGDSAEGQPQTSRKNPW